MTEEQEIAQIRQKYNKIAKRYLTYINKTVNPDQVFVDMKKRDFETWVDTNLSNLAIKNKNTERLMHLSSVILAAYKQAAQGVDFSSMDDVAFENWCKIISSTIETGLPYMNTQNLSQN